MVKWTLVYTKQAQKDAKKIARNPQLKANVQKLVPPLPAKASSPEPRAGLRLKLPVQNLGLD